MDNFIDGLNELTNNEYKFMLKSALLKKDVDFCVIEIFYKDGIILDAIKKEKIMNWALSVLPSGFKYQFKFVKNFISEEKVTNDFAVFMIHTFPSVSYNLDKVELNNTTFVFNVKIDTNSFERANQKHFSERVINHFKKMYEDYDFECKVLQDKVFFEDQIELLKQSYVEEDIDIYANRKIEVTNLVSIVGESIETSADYIIDKKSPQENVVLCGKIKTIKAIILKPRKKKETENVSQEILSEREDVSMLNSTEETQLEDSQTGYQRKMYKWVLEDFTSSINCVFFSNKENQTKVEKLDENSIIIVRGKTEEDKFSKGMSFIVKDIAYCSLPEKFEEYIEYKKEKPFYEFIQPEPVVFYQQDNLMNFADSHDCCEYLKNKTFVCFDFETTGLHYETGDKIVEIGAVKIVDGVITEKFMCFVDPEMHIPESASEISGIVDEDVKGAPKDYEALQDFYKFTRGAILTGYNIAGFDMRFLIGQGKKCRWNFDNEIIDTYDLARKFVFGVKNYKLGTIATKLGVVLDNAHRAVYDALATAEVFIKLAQNIKNN